MQNTNFHSTVSGNEAVDGGKATPGPWRMHAGHAYDSGGYSDPAYEIESSEGYRIGSVSDYNGKPQNEANARLIASAPDLLDALRRAKTLIEQLGYPVDVSISAAIAKATALADAKGLQA